MNIKKFLLDNFTFENLDKALNKIEKGFTAFQNGMDQFNKGVNDFTKELKFDLDTQDQNNYERQKINSKHLKKLWGNSNSSNVKIWSDKKNNETLF